MKEGERARKGERVCTRRSESGRGTDVWCVHVCACGCVYAGKRESMHFFTPVVIDFHFLVFTYCCHTHTHTHTHKPMQVATCGASAFCEGFGIIIKDLGQRSLTVWQHHYFVNFRRGLECFVCVCVCVRERERERVSIIYVETSDADWSAIFFFLGPWKHRWICDLLREAHTHTERVLEELWQRFALVCLHNDVWTHADKHRQTRPFFRRSD